MNAVCVIDTSDKRDIATLASADSQLLIRMKRIGKWRQWMVIVVTCLTVGAALFYCSSTRLGHDASAQTRLEVIGQALRDYCSHYGTLPPRVVRDANGGRHSWRAMVLPFMQESRYSFSESWNSDGNLFAASSVTVFDGATTDGGSTIIFAVEGQSGMWREDRSVSLDDCVSACESTLLLVEVPSMRCPWGEPVDITVDNLSRVIQEHPDQDIDVLFVGGRHAYNATTRGHVEYPSHGVIPSATPLSVWRRLSDARLR